MPRWLLETFAQLAIILIGSGLALAVTLLYAITWPGNGGATVAEPFDPLAQLIFTGLWFAILAGIWMGSRKVLSLLD